MIFNLCIIFITIRTCKKTLGGPTAIQNQALLVGDKVELELWEPDLEVDALVEVRDELGPEILQELLMPEDDKDKMVIDCYFCTDKIFQDILNILL